MAIIPGNHMSPGTWLVVLMSSESGGSFGTVCTKTKEEAAIFFPHRLGSSDANRPSFFTVAGAIVKHTLKKKQKSTQINAYIKHFAFKIGNQLSEKAEEFK